MVKFSLHIISRCYSHYLYEIHIGNEKHTTFGIIRGTAVETRKGIPLWRETLFQDAVSCRPIESGRHVCRESRREDGDGAAYREQMVQTVQGGRRQGAGDPSRKGTQADNGLFGRGICQAGDRAGSAEREQGSRGMAAGQRE